MEVLPCFMALVLGTSVYLSLNRYDTIDFTGKLQGLSKHSLQTQALLVTGCL